MPKELKVNDVVEYKGKKARVLDVVNDAVVVIAYIEDLEADEYDSTSYYIYTSAEHLTYIGGNE